MPAPSPVDSDTDLVDGQPVPGGGALNQDVVSSSGIVYICPLPPFQPMSTPFPTKIATWLVNAQCMPGGLDQICIF